MNYLMRIANPYITQCRIVNPTQRPALRTSPRTELSIIISLIVSFTALMSGGGAPQALSSLGLSIGQFSLLARTARIVNPQHRKKLSLISFPFSEKAKRYGPNDTSGMSDDDQ